jgi:class 3 adenylate cyclase
MPFKTIEYNWEWELHSSPETLWPLAADTNRFDRDTGLSPLTPLPTGQPLPNARLRARFFQYGIPVEYEQQPFEWKYPEYFSVTRNFTRGPLAQLRMRATFHPTPAGGTRLTYDAWATPANLLGVIAIPLQIGWLARRNFGSAFKKYDQYTRLGKHLDNTHHHVRLVPGAPARLQIFEGKLTAAGADPRLVQRLIHTLLNADDLTISRMRPYEYADYWQAPRRAALELFLTATRLGLLNFRWDVLCPMCRMPKQSVDTLQALQYETHCDTCRVTYTANFAESVEVTFRPNDTIRQVETREFCIGSPAATPHVLNQFMLQPGGTETLTPTLAAGRYRLRTFDLPGNQYLRADPEGTASTGVSLTPAGWLDPEPVISLQPEITVRNEGTSEQLFLFERLAWADTAVTAAEVIANQKFRDLFSHEALRPGEKISVGSMAIVFTDLRGSTRLYREIGDAPAFGHVMQHFDIIRSIFLNAEGVLVKTLGDAVMAVFRRPVNALEAVRRAQQDLRNYTIEGKPVFLKAGVHFGHCIAVTLNGQLDFFGSTVNAASRLESYSDGENVIISDAAYADPEVQEFIARAGLHAKPVQVVLKGFEGEDFLAWELTAP